jgi:xanthine dehydrogenase accessory factor
MDILEEQLKAQKSRTAYAVLTVAETEGTSAYTIGKKMLLFEDGKTVGTVGGGRVERLALDDALRAIQNRQSFYKWYEHNANGEAPGLGCTFKAALLVEVFNPKLQLVVCGAGHVGGSILRLAKMLPFETVLVDHRAALLIQDKIDLADVFINCNTYEEGVASSVILDGAFYVCCASTHTQDKSALKGALKRNFTYIGMLGSVQKREDIFTQLEEEGVGKGLLERVYAPVGLDICDISPIEVAFSILAEILMVKNQTNGLPRRIRVSNPGGDAHTPKGKPKAAEKA